MSAIKITIVVLGAAMLFGFVAYGINDAVQRNNKLEFQKVQLKSKAIEIEQLNTKQDKLLQDLKKAQEDKNTSQEELKKLQEQGQKFLEEKKQLEAQLQAKAEAKNRLSVAATRVANVGVATASASSGGCDSYIAQAGITHPIAVELITRENNACDPCVYNDGSPTGGRNCNYDGERAYGIPQSLPGNKMASEGADWRTNPVTQLRWMQKYVYGRYGSWESAKAHHDAMGWY